MANVGDHVSVGQEAPETGRYKHSACSNTIILNKGDIVPFCEITACRHKGEDWILQEKLT